MEWDQGSYTVTWKGQSVTLLPKEYALLRYLYDHAGKTLSRGQLLDGVWAMEAPVDRTVDDHIYRLRRKLALWAPAVQIDTIRGLGYRLQLKRAGETRNPLHDLSSFTSEMNGIAGTYLRYGRGEALLTLARHKQVLGFEVDPAFQLLIRVMEGDVRFIVEESEGSFEERAYLLLYLNQLVEPQRNRAYVEAVLESRLLPDPWHTELATMNMVSLLMDWNDFAGAKDKLDALAAQVDRNQWEGLIPYTANLQLEYVLRAGLWTQAEEAIAHVEQKLHQYPYMREEGQFRILRGIWVHRSDMRAGTELVQEGLAILKQSQFLANLLNGYHTLLMLADPKEWGANLRLFVKEWERLTAQIGLDEIAGRIRAQLDERLMPL